MMLLGHMISLKSLGRKLLKLNLSDNDHVMIRKSLYLKLVFLVEISEKGRQGGTLGHIARNSSFA